MFGFSFSVKRRGARTIRIKSGTERSYVAVKFAVQEKKTNKRTL